MTSTTFFCCRCEIVTMIHQAKGGMDIPFACGDCFHDFEDCAWCSDFSIQRNKQSTPDHLAVELDDQESLFDFSNSSSESTEYSCPYPPCPSDASSCEDEHELTFREDPYLTWVDSEIERQSISDTSSEHDSTTPESDFHSAEIQLKEADEGIEAAYKWLASAVQETQHTTGFDAVDSQIEVARAELAVSEAEHSYSGYDTEPDLYSDSDSDCDSEFDSQSSSVQQHCRTLSPCFKPDDPTCITGTTARASVHPPEQPTTDNAARSIAHCWLIAHLLGESEADREILERGLWMWQCDANDRKIYTIAQLWLMARIAEEEDSEVLGVLRGVFGDPAEIWTRVAWE